MMEGAGQFTHTSTNTHKTHALQSTVLDAGGILVLPGNLCSIPVVVMGSVRSVLGKLLFKSNLSMSTITWLEK